MGQTDMVTSSSEPAVEAVGLLPSWDLRDLYDSPTDPRIEAAWAAVSVQCEEFAKRYKGRLADLSGAELAQAVADYEALKEIFCRIASYSSLLFAADMSVPEHGQFDQTVTDRLTAPWAQILFFTLDLNRIPEAVLSAQLQAPELAHYAPWVRDSRVFMPHQRSEEIEQLFMEKHATAHAAWLRLYQETASGLKLDVAGEQLSLADAENELSNPDRAKREAAFKAIAKKLTEHEKLFALIYNTLAKDKAIGDEWHNYPHPWSARHRANMVEDEVVDALTSAVKDSYGRLMHRYYALKAKWLGLPQLAHWDRSAPLPGEDDKLIPWAQAQEIVLNAYKGFSPELGALAQQFFDKNWIDAPPRPGKDGGAFSASTVPSVHPYVLTNYYGKPHDVMILAHELGHGVHQCLAANQGLLLAETPYTLGETASVFGEMLTFRALLDAQSDPAKRRLILASKVEDMLNTTLRQIGLYEFEVAFHTERRKGEVLPARINEIWEETQQRCLGPAFAADPAHRIYWAAIPHFFSVPFYLYAYAFGDCLVNALYAVYQATPDKADFVKKYHEMLAAGGSKRHKELLAPFGLDASDPAFWQKGLDVISGFVDELERI